MNSAKQPRTPAEAQIEALRQLKQAQARRKLARGERLPPAPPAAPAQGPVFELSEQPPRPARKAGPSLPLSAETWRRLRERQAQHREFRRRRDMGEWAARLLLALPPGTAALPEAARQELFARMAEWAKSRGLG